MKNQEERIKKIIAEQLYVDIEKVLPDANLESDLGADSLDLMELIMVIEGSFDIEIADDVAEKVTTVTEVVNLVNELSGVI